MQIKRLAICYAAALALLFIDGLSTAQAQPSNNGPQRRGRGSAQAAPTVENIVARMMAFDKNKDGQLTKDEITDPRLLRVFERADANHDGVVTLEEMTALAKKMMAEAGNSRGGFGPGGDDGPGGGPDGPGGFGPPGFGPPGFGGGGPPPPRPGQLLPPHVEDSLELSADQKAQIAVLQKEVMAKLDKILTDKQKAAMKSMGPPEGAGPPPPPDE